MLEGAVGAPLLDAFLLVEPVEELVGGESGAICAVVWMCPEAVGEWFGVTAMLPAVGQRSVAEFAKDFGALSP